MNLVRFEPWSLIDRMQCDFDRRSGRRARRDTPAIAAAAWRPAVDIVEQKARFVLRADLPGVDRDDVDVSMEDGCLTITGERASEDRSEVDGIERYERVSGRFYRRFSLPESADADAIKARMRNGILEIEIPKLPEVQPRRIDIEAA